MASEAQIAANRLNAQKSTGPRTPRGKAMMRRNPLRHGLYAAAVVLFYESEAEFEEFREALAVDFEPQGAEECALVEQIAILRWRLRRASRAEAALVNAEAERRRERLANGASKTLYPIDAGMAFSGLGQGMSTLTRYEAAIERQLARAIGMLERRQARRFERGAREEAEPADAPAEPESAEPASASEPGPAAQKSRVWDSRANSSKEINGRDASGAPTPEPIESTESDYFGFGGTVLEPDPLASHR
jgi:hypothetical protein